MKETLLAQDRVTQVDDDLYEWLNQWKWYYSRRYACRPSGEGKSMIAMHRIIMNPPDDMYIDHIDGDRLNNLRENLRICTLKENSRNVGLLKTNTSGYKGVTWNKRMGKWTSQIMVDGKYIVLGFFDDKVEAACVRNAASIRYFGEFARLNEVPGTPSEWEAILVAAEARITRNPNTSGYVGVWWSKYRKKWDSYIYIDSHRIRLGRFDTKEEAAYMRDQALVQLYGDSAKLSILKGEAIDLTTQVITKWS